MFIIVLSCCIITYTGWPKKTKLSFFVHIFTKYWPIFTIFSPVDSVRNLLLVGMHTTPTMSLHYLVKHRYPKTNNIIHLLVVTSDGRFGKKRKRFDSIRVSATNELIRFNSIRFTALSESPSTVHTRGSGLWSEAAGPVHRSHNRPARIATVLLIAFAEASGNIDANASHDEILQHSDAHS